MALFLSARRGWLPAGFTELEYLESSGTQYIDTRIVPDNETGQKCDYYANFQSGDCFVSGVNENAHYVFMPMVRSNGSGQTSGYGWGKWNAKGTLKNVCRALTSLNFLNDRKAICASELLNYADNIVNLSFVPTVSVFLFGANNGALTHSFSGKVYHYKMSQGSEITHDLVPVLDRDGTPCMFDKISKQRFYNDGTGTFGYRIKTTGEESAPFSLRDPYRTAPSGVYARIIAENELEILADTDETTGDGWEWFANTGEAYEHFGIVQEEELLTTNEQND